MIRKDFVKNTKYVWNFSREIIRKAEMFGLDLVAMNKNYAKKNVVPLKFEYALR